jgi:hypothetical protein
MAHFFKILKNKDEYASIAAPSVVVKNVSGGPFEVDEDGRVLPHNSVAAIDGSCKICNAGINDGKLVVVHQVAKQQQPKQKAKAANLSPEPAQAEVGGPEQTVASTQDAESVQ